MFCGMLTALIFVTCVRVTFTANGEVQLMKDLFENYSIDARPVKDDKKPVVVRLGMALAQIVDVKEKEEYLSISTMLRQYWTDENLVWDPAKYNGVSAVNIRPNKIWKPDIVLYNNVDEDKSFSGSLDQLNNRIIVNSSGYIKWLTPAILTAKCPMNVKYFPFDTQLCTLKFGSWTYDGFKLDMLALTENVDLSVYQNHSEWYLEKGVLERHVVKYGCCPEPFPDVTVYITLKRRSLFYLMNLIFPMVVISMLTMLAFYLPSESGERIALAITLLLAMTVFMLIVGEIIPPTSDTVPLVASFFSAVMVEMVLMIIILCYILKLHFKTSSDDPMPNWMRNVVLNKLSYFLWIRKRKNATKPSSGPFAVKNIVSKDTELEDYIKNIEKNNGNSQNGTAITYVQNGKLHRNNDVTSTFENCFLAPTPTTPSTKNQHKTPIGPRRSEENAYMKLISKKVDVFIQRFLDEDEENVVKEEWRICAMTLDRMSLILFGIIFTVTALGCFLSAPGYTS